MTLFRKLSTIFQIAKTVMCSDIHSILCSLYNHNKCVIYALWSATPGNFLGNFTGVAQSGDLQLISVPEAKEIKQERKVYKGSEL